jgi:AcrR family transcriptional regulator
MTVGANYARRLRADASRNRDRILAAAREAFVEYGGDASIDEIARRAGVGNATVYRHFVDRAELHREVVLWAMGRIADQAEAAVVEEPDTFEALRRFVYAAADERAGALCLLAHGFEELDLVFLKTRDRLERAIDDVVNRARSSGRLRTDVGTGDLMVAISQLTRPLPGRGCLEFDGFVRRHLQLFLDGLQASARSELPGSSATFEELQLQRRPGPEDHKESQSITNVPFRSSLHR